MKEIIIRMKDMYEVYGDDFDPEEIEPTHTGEVLEIWRSAEGRYVALCVENCICMRYNITKTEVML